jgi:hypothetical protein
MATFREIDEAILALVDEETGELLDAEAFEALQMERTQKAENMALWALDLKDEQESIRGEIKRLQARLAAAERKEKSLRDYLAIVLGGEKLKTARITVSYRKAAAVEITDEDEVRKWAMLAPQGEDILKYKEPEISKTELKRLISEGHTVPGAAVVERVSVQIK